jgi:REP element-mobilizing transposase RayT
MPDLPNLREARLAAAIGESLRAAARRDTAKARVRVVQFSIQADHLHLLVEAASFDDLANGMRGLGVRLARAVNRELGRRGSFANDRYHARELETPRDARNALVYVLGNWRKHVRAADGSVDPCSSARWFGGWASPVERSTRPPPVHAAATWLLNVGWRRHGLLHVGERPAPA